MYFTIEKATQIACEVAHDSTLKRYRLGCVLYDRSKYVTGYSHIHGVIVPSRSNQWSIHAEEMAIIKGSRIGIDFPNSILLVVRINNNNDLLLAKPCPVCTNLINHFNIKRIYYSDNNKEIKHDN